MKLTVIYCSSFLCYYCYCCYNSDFVNNFVIDVYYFCRKKWNKIKKSALSSKFKGMPRDGHLSNDNLLKLKESSTNVESPARGLRTNYYIAVYIN